MNVVRAVWKSAVESNQLSAEQIDVLKNADRSELVGLLRETYRGNADEIRAAGGLFTHLPSDVQKELFDEIVWHCLTQRFTTSVTPIVAALPRHWVLAHIERSVEPMMQNADNVDYSLLLQLYRELDHELARQTALRALASDDADIREVGQDFLNSLS